VSEKSWYEYPRTPRLEKTQDERWLIKTGGEPAQLNLPDRDDAYHIFEVVQAAFRDGLREGRAEVRGYLRDALGSGPNE
jgi:uncharacterized protein (DUF2267 family)